VSGARAPRPVEFHPRVMRLRHRCSSDRSVASNCSTDSALRLPTPAPLRFFLVLPCGFAPSRLCVAFLIGVDRCSSVVANPLRITPRPVRLR
jgi:hypothetical protein